MQKPLLCVFGCKIRERRKKVPVNFSSKNIHFLVRRRYDEKVYAIILFQGYVFNNSHFQMAAYGKSSYSIHNSVKTGKKTKRGCLYPFFSVTLASLGKAQIYLAFRSLNRNSVALYQ